MTLRYGHDGKPAGLDWSVCNDGNPQPEVWGFNAPKPASVKKAVPKDRPSPTRRIAPEVEQEIIRLYGERRMSAKQVAEITGVSPVTVFKSLERNGVPTRSKSEGMRLRKAQADG